MTSLVLNNWALIATNIFELCSVTSSNHLLLIIYTTPCLHYAGEGGCVLNQTLFENMSTNSAECDRKNSAECD